MGAITSRRSSGVEEIDLSGSSAYRYPPKSGLYFASHFIMGGEKFETTQPEAYLFGENQDLNFLGSKPVPFPYPAPQPHEPTKTLKSLVNIRKDSLKFVKAVAEDGKENRSQANVEQTEVSVGSDAVPSPDNAEADGPTEDHAEPPPDEHPTKYNIEFTFDTDVKCAITVYYFATEEIVNKKAIYHPREASMNSETFHYKRGPNQVFNQSTHVIDPSKYSEEEWQYNPDKDVIPVVIHCVVEEEEHAGHSHITFAIVEKSPDGGYVLKPLKQKQMVDGLCYLLQEIYGIENKNNERAKQDDDIEDNGSECVICLVEMRDTLILPCRHLCLCNCCADNLRYQASNCPICRSPFRALLQIRAMQKKSTTRSLSPVQYPPSPDCADLDNPICQEGVPPGYEAVSLVEALNGPLAPGNPVPANQTNFTDVSAPVAMGSPGKQMKRKGSSSSNRSRCSVVEVRAGENAAKSAPTREDSFTDGNPAASKMEVSHGSPKASSSPKKTPSRKKRSKESLEYVDETMQETNRNSNCLSEDIDDHRTPTPPPDYTDTDEEGTNAVSRAGGMEVIFKPVQEQSYPSVSIYKDDLEKSEAEEEEDGAAAQASDAILAGSTFDADGSSSSYSSTGSSKGLMSTSDAKGEPHPTV